MKKKISVIVALTLVCALALCACGGEGGADVAKLVFATGGTQGTYYAYGGSIASVINDASDTLDLTVTSTGGSQANVELLQSGEAQIAFCQNDVAYYAYTGTDLFADAEADKDLCAVVSLYDELIQIVGTSDITDIAGLKGKRVSVGTAGSGTYFNARQILEAYGMTMDDIVPSYLDFGGSTEAFKNGQIDAFFVVAGIPNTAITDLATSNSFNILEVSDEALAKLGENYSFYTRAIIPAGTYSNIAEDRATLAIKAVVICHKDLSADAVKEFLTQLFANKADLAAANAKGELLSYETALAGVNIPVHDAAKAYYEANGVTVG